MFAERDAADVRQVDDVVDDGERLVRVLARHLRQRIDGGEGGRNDQVVSVGDGRTQVLFDSRRVRRFDRLHFDSEVFAGFFQSLVHLGEKCVDAHLLRQHKRDLFLRGTFVVASRAAAAGREKRSQQNDQKDHQ